jgi:hypothetical protein
MDCLVCDAPLPAPAAVGRPRRYCSAACRQRAYHARHLAEQPVVLPENAIDESVCGQQAEPLLAAIVFVPVADENWVYAVHAFGEFPWHRLVADLRSSRESISSPENDVSSGLDEVICGRDV